LVRYATNLTQKLFESTPTSPPGLLLRPHEQKMHLTVLFCTRGPLGLSTPRCRPHKGILGAKNM
jgi:hypothetical protein